MQTAKLVTERIWGLGSKKNHHLRSKESYGGSLNPMTSSGQPGFRVAQPLQRHGYPRTEPVGKGGGVAPLILSGILLCPSKKNPTWTPCPRKYNFPEKLLQQTPLKNNLLASYHHKISKINMLRKRGSSDNWPLLINRKLLLF